MVSNVDPDPTAPGSTLFAHTCLSENIGSLRQYFFGYDINSVCDDFHLYSHLSLMREWPSIVARGRIIQLKFEQYSGLT